MGIRGDGAPGLAQPQLEQVESRTRAPARLVAVRAMYARDSWTHRRSTSSGGRCPRPGWREVWAHPGFGFGSWSIELEWGAAHLVQREGRTAPAGARDEPGQLGEGLGCPRAARSDARRPSRRPPVARGHTLDARHEVPRWGQPQSAPPMTPSLCRLRRGKGRLDRQEAVVGHPVLVLLAVGTSAVAGIRAPVALPVVARVELLDVARPLGAEATGDGRCRRQGGGRNCESRD